MGVQDSVNCLPVNTFIVVAHAKQHAISAVWRPVGALGGKPLLAWWK